MVTRSKFALAAAFGAVSLFALNALAQQQGTSGPANPPSAAAPSTSAPSSSAPAEPADGSQSSRDDKAAATQDKDAAAAESGKPSSAADSNNRYHRRWSQQNRGEQRWHRRGESRQGMRNGNRWRNLSDTDKKAYFEARIAAVRAGLMLNETQARLWPSVETAVREMVAKRTEWRQRIQKEGRPANPFDRMKRRGDMMADRGAALQKFATAAKPLYDTLTDDQKQRLRVLTRGFGRFSRQNGMRQQPMQRWQRHGSFQQRYNHHQGSGRQYGDGGQGRRWRQGFNEDNGTFHKDHSHDLGQDHGTNWQRM